MTKQPEHNVQNPVEFWITAELAERIVVKAFRPHVSLKKVTYWNGRSYKLWLVGPVDGAPKTAIVSWLEDARQYMVTYGNTCHCITLD